MGCGLTGPTRIFAVFQKPLTAPRTILETGTWLPLGLRYDIVEDSKVNIPLMNNSDHIMYADWTTFTCELAFFKRIFLYKQDAMYEAG